MALPAPLQALFDRLQAYNNGPYNAQSNPLGLSRGGNQNPVANFLSSLKDFSAFGKGISDLTKSAADNAALTAADREQTGEDVIASAASASTALGAETRARDEANRAASYGNPNRLTPQRLNQLSW